jgi:hypothetical protein
MGWLQGVTSSRDAGATPLAGTPLRSHPLLAPLCVIPEWAVPVKGLVLVL